MALQLEEAVTIPHEEEEAAIILQFQGVNCDLELYPILFQALNKGMQLRRLRNSYKSPPIVYGQNHPIKRVQTSNDNNNNVNFVPATFSLYA